ACARGLRSMRLEVRADNEPAIRLYEKTGYRSFAQYENYYHDGMSALRYQKALCALNTENGPR
ncbi:MAG: ribosomal-protein-alanine acetyltransferase, partial [Nitratireductor sp.]